MITDIKALRERLMNICSDITFDEAYHQYTLEGVELKPVTQAASAYLEPFRSWQIASQMAEKFSKQSDKPVTPQEIIRHWEKLREVAADKGTRVHTFIENYPVLPREAECEEEQGAINWYKQLPAHYHPLIQEKIVYSRRRGIAGKFDKLFYNEQTSSLMLVDWKTCKDILKNYKGKKLKPPFENMLDTPLNKYMIQQSLYAICLEEHLPELLVTEMYIIHLHKDLPNYFCSYAVEDLRPKLLLTAASA